MSLFDVLVPFEDATFGGFLDADGCHHDSRADYLYLEVLHLCGCGEPDSVARYIGTTLRRYVGRPGESAEAPSYDDLPTMFFLYWADHAGYVEHGTTIRCGWLTAKGEALLEAIDTVLKEEGESSDA